MYVNRPFVIGLGVALLGGISAPGGFAAPLPGGTQDPTLIPKYVIPLVIPPEMPKSPTGAASPYNQGANAAYNIAERQFRQQILPGGIWNTVNGRTDTFAATPVWSYGRAEDPIPPGGIAPVPATQSSLQTR